jgi:hypothetical protein
MHYCLFLSLGVRFYILFIYTNTNMRLGLLLIINYFPFFSLSLLFLFLGALEQVLLLV